ncbi:MAG: hypothetical protein IH845_02450 [Nanoarchaeota archaeon]|nr:hypothetical protein [Nanoarchaeota archaeon]
MDNSLKLLAARFIKISATRLEDFEGKISIATNIKITSIENTKDSNDAVKVSYTFEVDYGELGSIEIIGYLFLGAEKKTIKELVKAWEKKEFDSPEHATITNIILKKASIKALELEEELSLPIHLKLPTITLNKD